MTRLALERNTWWSNRRFLWVDPRVWHRVLLCTAHGRFDAPFVVFLLVDSRKASNIHQYPNLLKNPRYLFFSYLLDSASLCSPNLALTWNILTHHPCEKKNPCSVAKATTWSIPRRGQRHLEGSLMIFVPALVKFRKTGFYTVSWNSQRWDRIYCKQTCIITAHKQGTNSMIHDVSHPWKPNSCGQRSWCCPCLLHPSWSQSPLRTTNGASNNLYALFWIPICLSHSSDMVKFEPVLTWPLQRLHQHERQWRQWSNKQMEGLYELDCPTMPLRPLFLQRQQTIIIKTCKGRKRHFPDPWDR